MSSLSFGVLIIVQYNVDAYYKIDIYLFQFYNKIKYIFKILFFIMGWLTRFFCGNFFEVRNQIKKRNTVGVSNNDDSDDDEFA